MSLRHTTTYLVLTRSVGAEEFVSVPMINRTFRAAVSSPIADRARALLAAHLGVQQDSFAVEIVRVDTIPTQRAAA